MATSRELKIYRNSDIKSSIDSIEEENSFEFSITRNNKTIKTQLNCPEKIVPELEYIKKSNKDTLELNLKKSECSRKNIPKLNLDFLLKKCSLNKITLYDYDKNSSILSNNTEVNKKIGFNDLKIDLLKILTDVKKFMETEKEGKNCFGLVTYNELTKEMNFYSFYDDKKSNVLGSVNLTETVLEIENKIPLISVLDESLKIEQEL